MNHSDKWHRHRYACLTTCVFQRGNTDGAVAHTNVFYPLHFRYNSTKIKIGAGGSQFHAYHAGPAVPKGIATAISVFGSHLIPLSMRANAGNHTAQFESGTSTSNHTSFLKSNTSCTNY